MRLVLRRPGATLALAAVLLVVVQVGYGKFGSGVEFFPAVEPDYGQVIVHARGNLSLDEKNRFLAEAEKRVLEAKGLKTVYTRVGEQPKGSNELSEDTIGVIQFEFADWRTRPPAHEIMDGIRDRDRGHSRHPGRGDGAARRPADRQADPGPARRARSGAVAGRRQEGRRRCWPSARTSRTSTTACRCPASTGRSTSIRRRPPSSPPIRRSVGTALQLVTNGIKATEYRPAGSDKAVDILVRFPEDRRSLDQMDELRVQTPSGSVPISNFVERVAAPRVGFINRVAGNRVMTVSANVAQGVQTAKVQEEIAKELATADLGSGVTWRLKGEDEERAKAGAFLMKAFGTAIFMIFAILLAQFNRLTSVGLVLSAVILSTIGVLLGLLVMGQPFGVVMTGIGVIANAGVIVNNNIVLIDTYDRLRREGWEAYDAIVETCRERARPVVLTAVTAVLGVLPIAFGVNIEFLHPRDHRSARRRRSGGSASPPRSCSASALRPC